MSRVHARSRAPVGGWLREPFEFRGTCSWLRRTCIDIPACPAHCAASSTGRAPRVHLWGRVEWFDAPSFSCVRCGLQCRPSSCFRRPPCAGPSWPASALRVPHGGNSHGSSEIRRLACVLPAFASMRIEVDAVAAQGDGTAPGAGGVKPQAPDTLDATARVRWAPASGPLSGFAGLRRLGEDGQTGTEAVAGFDLATARLLNGHFDVVGSSEVARGVGDLERTTAGISLAGVYASRPGARRDLTLRMSTSWRGVAEGKGEALWSTRAAYGFRAPVAGHVEPYLGLAGGRSRPRPSVGVERVFWDDTHLGVHFERERGDLRWRVSF